MPRPATIAPAGTPLTEAEQIARVFRALGEERRLRILESLLARGPLTQSQLVRRLGIPQSRVSEHLRCLAWCGLVQPTGETRPRYAVTDPRVPALLELARAFLQDNEAAISTCGVLDA